MNRFFILPYLASLIILSGCLAGGEIRDVEFERIDLASWPTPVPKVTATPTTPLVKIDLPPTATRPVVASSTQAAVDQEDVVSASIDTTDLAASRPRGLPIVGIASIRIEEAIVRRGPSASAAPAGMLELGDLAGVYGRDTSGEWIFVQTISRTFGWVAYNDVYALDTLDEAPVLPSNPLSLILDQSSTASAGAAGSAAALPETIVDVDSLESVVTAQVSGPVLNLRQRPGANYTLLDALAEGDDLEILALNRDGEWALVKTNDEQLGWVSMDFLNIAGSVANAPRVRTLDQGPNNVAAPIVLALGAAAPSESIQSQPVTSDVGASTAAVPVTAALHQGPPLPSNTLAVKTTAQVVEKIDLRRGPDSSYGTVDEITVDETVSVRGVNNQGDWVIVEALDSGGVGWAPAEALTLAGSLSGAPPVSTGWIESNGLEIRSGPGIIYGVLGRLSIYDMVSVLAINEGRNWLLIETLSGGQGWLPRNQVDVVGSLTNTPVVSSPLVSTQKQSLPAVGAAEVALSGKLVFQTSAGGDIMVINADGTGLRKLTTGLDPVLSPDGQQVAFSRWDSSQDGARGSLLVINIDGSDERVIHSDVNNPRAPTWSADGGQIAITMQQGGRLNPEYTCGNQPPPKGATDTTTSHAGGKTEFCYVQPPDPHWGLRQIDVATGEFQDLPRDIYSFSPSWDPANSQRLVYDGDFGLMNLNLNENRPQALTEDINDQSPIFSPDGSKIAVNYQQDDHWEVHVLNTDGGGRVRLTETPFWVPLDPDSQGVQWNNAAPTWSPDGSQIAFLSDRNGQWEIWLMHADGSNQRPMFPDGALNSLALDYAGVNERMLSWR